MTIWQPFSISSVVLLSRVPIFSRSLVLSTVAIWVTTTTLDLGIFPIPFLNLTFPGTAVSFLLEVTSETTVVWILLF